VDQGPVDRELGSTDVGNVSQVVPTIQPMVQICPREVACHMTAFAEAAASDVGHRAMFAAAKAMAMTAVDLLTDPSAVARAAAEGYKAITGKRKPYHGYFYRFLFAQGANAQGGAAEYFVDGLLTQGVALLAWPADYGASGIMSFMINHDGVVYQKDFGEETGMDVEKIQVFDPDSSWSIVESDEDS